MSQLRNIKSIQVFSETCRVGNVTRTAETLSISQSSVSYHIKKLERDLGAVLFRRTPSGLEPTDEGMMLYNNVERGFAAIKHGVDQVANRASNVKFALLPMFASRWLSPRLGRLMEAHPEIGLSIVNHNNSFAHAKTPESFADIGIQWGLGKWSNLNVHRLWPEHLVAVCSPGYQRDMAIARPEDLRRCTLVHVDDTRMWSEWYEHHGLDLSPTHSKMVLEDRHFQLSSTINGLGVSLFAHWLVEEELESGALVNPFGTLIPTAFSYFAITPKVNDVRWPVQTFLNWLLDECQGTKRHALASTGQ